MKNNIKVNMLKFKWNLIVFAVFIFTPFLSWTTPPYAPSSQSSTSRHSSDGSTQAEALNPDGKGAYVAIFAGGCFWCMESGLEHLQGVKRVLSGYTGGHMTHPSYTQVSTGQTDHLEAVWVEFDPKIITYEALIEAFWHNIDPTQSDGQFADRGSQYLTAIFYLDENQHTIASRSKKKLSESGRFQAPIFTPLRKASLFWPAEAYHQDYYKKNPAHYQRYREGSGRGPFIRRVWGEK